MREGANAVIECRVMAVENDHCPEHFRAARVQSPGSYGRALQNQVKACDRPRSNPAPRAGDGVDLSADNASSIAIKCRLTAGCGHLWRQMPTIERLEQSANEKVTDTPCDTGSG